MNSIIAKNLKRLFNNSVDIKTPLMKTLVKFTTGHLICTLPTKTRFSTLLPSI